MDINWIHIPDRACDEYLSRIGEFIRVARNHVNYCGHIKCPCLNCNNCSWKSVSEIRQHLMMYVMSYNYTILTHHGERLGTASSSSITSSVTKPNDDIGCDNDQVMGIINDMYPSTLHYYKQNILEEEDVLVDDDTLKDDRTSNLHRQEIDKYEQLLKEAQKELYPGCEGIVKRMLPKPPTHRHAY
ncbi:hypothetical protein Dsin_019043 [Dipteronia sinensis]|uniref:Transposase-associated domain-containing protein n=1 Tax=Dipteronia sinensis TaxID=43782 RepID=A0AAE0A709_9ROSI|nr:hypothetical protein Dsin_019043 [Dipteronia sinensis]